MKNAGMVLCGVLLLGTSMTLPAFAQTTPAGQARAGDKDDVRARVRTDLANWRVKMRAFDKRSVATGYRTADAQLHAAWERTKVAGRRIEDTSARDWDSVKASYESASHQMTLAWDKVTP